LPKVDSSGKFGTSMDTSQLTDIRRKYKTIQNQNSKPRPGDQNVKPIFNSNRVIGGGSSNGSSEYYVQKGLSLLFRRPGLTN
jgi:hypothetical protein